jgi:hypothetical protein
MERSIATCVPHSVASATLERGRTRLARVVHPCADRAHSLLVARRCVNDQRLCLIYSLRSPEALPQSSVNGGGDAVFVRAIALERHLGALDARAQTCCSAQASAITLRAIDR